jgi:outer membrane protein OmpA-like peptidoglycan-associated protein
MKNFISYLPLIVLLFAPRLTLSQKGDNHFSLFGGQSNYLIDRPSGQSSFIFNKVGLGYGYGIGKRINLFVNGELGALSYSKLILTPAYMSNGSSITSSAFGSLTTQLNSVSLGLEFRLLTIKKLSLNARIGSNFQAFENSFTNVVGERYRREYSGLLGLQLDYRLSKKWSVFINTSGNKPFMTTLNDPDFYMSNKQTDHSKDVLLNGVLGITFNIERKKNKDSDQDGVKDELDKCPDTPKGETVNQDGCSEIQLDNDADGIVNQLDKCPATPKGEKVNADGCSDNQLDDDKDGVSNQKDKCPNTTKGEKVNAEGCSESQLDDDKDGVNNLTDICKNTQPGQKVNAKGCALNQLDTDLDGVFDDVDKCPQEKGDKLNNGCPVVTKKIEKQIDDIANEVNFVTGKADLLVSSMARLNELLVILLENPELKIIISGHTDDVGNAESNFVLSEKRANSVLSYLAEKGIAKNRMTALAFGEEQLKANEISEESRAKNRRVEIKILK